MQHLRPKSPFEGGWAQGGAKKSRLLVRHIHQRYGFALQHWYWAVEERKHVAWFDEAKMNRLGLDGMCVWKKPGSAFTAQYVQVWQWEPDDVRLHGGPGCRLRMPHGRSYRRAV